MKAIIVENLSKVYSVATANNEGMSFREMLIDQARSLFKKSQQQEQFYALKDVSFEVEQGEVLGIIGKNGSGKSTLLKILSKITAPTSGRAIVRGRVASLLEVGTGFHAELTGRENIFMSGIILGMKRWEINQHFDEIVSFAGVEQFLDMPVKKYSSGMRLRLAFSVAAHLQPEILLVDEVLAVGDYEFEKKCLKVMEGISNAGRTILFVSHNMDTILRLCHRVILLSNGTFSGSGEPRSIVDQYLDISQNTSASVSWGSVGCLVVDFVDIYRVAIVNVSSSPCDMIYNDEPVSVQISYSINRSGSRVSFAFAFHNHSGEMLFVGFEGLAKEINAQMRDVGKYTSTCTVPAHIFKQEVIYVSLVLLNAGTEGKILESNILLRLSNIISFKVEQRNESVFKGFIWRNSQGVVYPNLRWQIQREV